MSDFGRKFTFDENIAVRKGSKWLPRLHLWSTVLVNCSDMSYATFIPTIVASVLPRAASRMRKCRFWPKTAVPKLRSWPKVLVNCLDMSYATFIPTIVSLVLPLAASRVRKCPILAENSGFYENIAVRNG